MPAELSMPRARGRFTYWREISAVLCLKVVGLAALYYLFFSPATQMTPTPQDVAHHLIDKAFSSEALGGPRDENAPLQKAQGPQRSKGEP